MKVYVEGYGELEARATALTLVIYEQEFGSDIIKDVFGRHEAEKSDGPVVDFTIDNWFGELKALWALVMTDYQLRKDSGDAAPNEDPGRFLSWVRKVGKVNFREIASAVFDECMDGFFHTGAAVSE